MNTDPIMTVSFIWRIFFNDFCNVIFSKGDRKKTVICYFKRISRKFASIVDYSALFSKQVVKDLSFLFEICNVIIIMINWLNTRFFFLFKNVPTIVQHVLRLIAGSINFFEFREKNCSFDFSIVAFRRF